MLDRRAFVKFASLAALGPWDVMSRASRATPASCDTKPDYTLHLQTSRIEVAPRRFVRTTTYNGRYPGPLIRLAAGRRTVIDICNDTSSADCVYWQGQNVTGHAAGGVLDDSGSVPARSRRRLELTPAGVGPALYHSSRIAADDLSAGLYGGAGGALLIEPEGDPGRYDREEILVLKEFSPSVRRTPGGSAVGYDVFTMNGRVLGQGEPIRVRDGGRVLFHVLNASATEVRRLALPGHLFRIVALDGNPVPLRSRTPVIWVGAGERVSAVVEMNQPGIWVLGEVCDDDRNRGMGIVVEYARCHGDPRWRLPVDTGWSYARFGLGPGTCSSRTGLETLEMTFARQHAGRGGFCRWTVNGRAFSSSQGDCPSLRIREGRRYRLRLRNATDDIQTIHLRRHRFELARVDGIETRGIVKDVVMIAANRTVEVEFTADSPGRTLLHSTRQWEMDFGLAALIDYVDGPQ